MKKSFLSIVTYIARWLPMPLKKFLYHLGPFSSGLRWMLNKAAPVGFSEIVVAGGDLTGMRLVLNMQEEKDYWLGTYEPELQAAVREWIKPGWIAYDVGANIGYISLLLAKAVGNNGKVFSFEALPANQERLRKNINLNLDHIGKVTIFSGAVTNMLAPVRFLIGPSDGMGKVEGSAGREMAYHQMIDVPGITLDDFVFHQGQPIPDVIKIDIEGGEVLALPGMRRLLLEKHPLLFIEMHGYEAARVVWDLLIDAGYTIYRMAPGYPVVPGLEALDWKAYLVAKPRDM